jgi:hypothetical protein
MCGISVSASVSGIRGAARRSAADGRVCSVGWAAACPMVTGVVRCDSVVRGPDVAPMWPARPEVGRRVRCRLPWPDATPLPQVRASVDRPLLTVSDRQMPVAGHAGAGRGGLTALWRGGDGHKLNRRVRLVLGDYLPRWQAPVGARQGNGRIHTSWGAWQTSPRRPGRGRCAAKLALVALFLGQLEP